MISDATLSESGMCEDIGQRVSEIRGDTVEQQLVIQLPTQKTSAPLTSQAFQLLSWT